MLGRGPLAFGPLAALTGFPGLTATLGVTLDALSLAATSRLPAQGTLGVTLGALTLAATGSVPSRGTLAAPLGPLALTATALVPSRGTLAATLGALTLAASGKAIITGTLGGTPAKMALWVPLAVQTPLADPAYPLQPLTLAATGTAVNHVFTATLAATLGPLTLAATANLPARGTLGTTLGPLAFTGTGGVLVRGHLGSDLTFGSMLGHGPIAAAPLASLTVSPGAVALDAVTLAATGTVAYRIFTGTLATTLGPLTLSAHGFAGTGAGTFIALAPLQLAGVGHSLVRATLGAALGPLTLSATGHVPLLPRTGSLHATLGPAVLTAFGSGTSAPINLPAWPHEWCSALGPSRTNTLAVDTAQFGDGYVHRSTRGLNPVQSTMAYVFPFMDIDQLTAMNTFLKTYGAQGFAFLLPDKLATVAVCASEWSATIIDRTGQDDDVVGTLQVTFARMFNPQPLQLPL
jgi:phage-related protein